MTGSGPHAATALPLARSRYAHGQWRTSRRTIIPLLQALSPWNPTN